VATLVGAGVLLGVVDRACAEAGEQLEPMEAALREAILERASPDEREALREGMEADRRRASSRHSPRRFPASDVRPGT
jgi:hypothetical protein